MKTYKYNGETFQITQDADCNLVVSDKGNTVLVTVGHSKSGYGNTATYEVYLPNNTSEVSFKSTEIEKAVNEACALLAKYRTEFTQEELGKSLSEFYDNLE